MNPTCTYTMIFRVEQATNLCSSPEMCRFGYTISTHYLHTIYTLSTQVWLHLHGGGRPPGLGLAGECEEAEDGETADQAQHRPQAEAGRSLASSLGRDGGRPGAGARHHQHRRRKHCHPGLRPDPRPAPASAPRTAPGETQLRPEPGPGEGGGRQEEEQEP